MKSNMPLKERLLSKIEKVNNCWMWRASTITGKKISYGIISNEGKREVAHRVSYKLFVGSIPDGYTVDHICKNGLCINPDHLRILTLKENILLGNSPIAKHAVKTHCIHGHKFTPENTRITKNGRACRLCSQLLCRKNYRKKHGANVRKDYKMTKTIQLMASTPMEKK